MIAITFAISPPQVATYSPTNPDTIDGTNNLLRLLTNPNSVTTVRDRTAVVTDKLPNLRKLIYTFQASSWEFTTQCSVEIMQLLGELDTANPDGIPCKNYLAAFNAGTPYTEMRVQLLEYEELAARILIPALAARPKDGYRLVFVRVDI